MSISLQSARPDGRELNQARQLSFIPHIAPHSTGSVLVCFGQTRVICSVTIENDVPRWMKHQKVAGGWLTAEYSMLPYSTLDRKTRDINRGKLDGRSSEIQRLIGRTLRSAIDLKALGSKTVWIDCDVLQADGGTRTASITGASVALEIAFNQLIAQGELKKSPLKHLVCAVSVGIYNDLAVLDLNYLEDRDATVDMNLIMTENLEYVEVQGGGEEATYTQEQLDSLLKIGREAIPAIAEKQKAAIEIAKEHSSNAFLPTLKSI